MDVIAIDDGRLLSPPPLFSPQSVQPFDDTNAPSANGSFDIPLRLHAIF
jgi:hypothetical protein